MPKGTATNRDHNGPPDRPSGTRALACSASPCPRTPTRPALAAVLLLVLGSLALRFVIVRLPHAPH